MFFLPLFLQILPFLHIKAEVKHNYQRLGNYAGNRNEVSISGFSSGGDFAIQYHVAFSSELKGVGSIGSVVYYCAENSYLRSTTCKSNPSSINTEFLIKIAQNFSDVGHIDDTSNIKGSKVFIFEGTDDTTVFPGNGPKIKEFYEAFEADVKSEFDIVAEHGIPTENFGNACTVHESPFIIDCNYNAAYMLLDHIYGNLIKPEKTQSLTGQLFEFDQREFIVGKPALISMDSTGYAYIPKHCKNNKGCKVHVAFHGCKQSKSFVGNTYALHAGYNEVAEVNNIIMIYPQTTVSLTNPVNPRSCYDWWGFTGSDYATKTGPQIIAIRNMIEEVLTD